MAGSVRGGCREGAGVEDALRPLPAATSPELLQVTDHGAERPHTFPRWLSQVG
jgi:hypothetical protein